MGSRGIAGGSSGAEPASREVGDPARLAAMKILVIGSGGVGSAIAAIAQRRDFFSSMIMADIDEERAKSVAAATEDVRFEGVKLDASDSAAIAKFARDNGITVVLNSADPRFVMPIFDAAFDAGCTYLDIT